MIILAFDVESIGLHGDGFAVGFVISDAAGVELEAGCFSCAPQRATGTDADREWVFRNVPALPITHDSPQAVRAAFWGRWRHWADAHSGVSMLGDCVWPVEARFLAKCVDDLGEAAAFLGPFPLLDVASLRAVCREQLGNGSVNLARLPDELPTHHPLADARYSLRQWRALCEFAARHRRQADDR